MKVSELIQKLSVFDSNARVTLSGDWYGEGHMYIDYDREIDFDD